MGACPNIFLFIIYQVSRQTQVIQMCMAELLYLINYWSKHLMLRLNIQEFLLVRNILLYDWNNVLRKYVGLLVVKCSPYLYWGYYVWAVKQILLQHLTYNQDNSTERIKHIICNDMVDQCPQFSIIAIHTSYMKWLWSKFERNMK